MAGTVNMARCAARLDHRAALARPAAPCTAKNRKNRTCEVAKARRKVAENVLYYADKLDILRRYVKDETVDLIYLDPPFKTNANYNVLFAEHNGSRAAAQEVLQ